MNKKCKFLMKHQKPDAKNVSRRKWHKECECDTKNLKLKMWP